MKKKIAASLTILLILANILFPCYQPSQDVNTAQPLNGWELEWI